MSQPRPTPTVRPRSRPKRSRFRPAVEGLEERTVPSFAAAVNYTVADGPRAVAAADFNGDGRSDLVTANQVGQSLSVLLNLGTGTFAAPTSRELGAGPTAVATADFNRDGFPDVAAAVNDNTIRVLVNDGAGTLLEPATYSVATGAIGLAAGDFNGDRREDLAVLGTGGGGTITVLLGISGGAFVIAGAFPSGASPAGLATGDLNGDGRLDLAVRYSTGPGTKVGVLLGEGDGSFNTATLFNAGTYTTSIAIADFNGDGKRDVIVGNADSGASVLLGTGTGALQAATRVDTDSHAGAVAVADFNGDGKHDLAAADSANPGRNPGGVNVVMGNGNGTFQAAFNAGSGRAPGGVAVADFNADGMPDLALANPAANNISVLLNRDAARSPGIGSFSVTTAGTALPNFGFLVTVSAKTPSGGLATTYTGTVRLSSPLAGAVLPADYTFTAADSGSHTFVVSLPQAGANTLTVTDLATNRSNNVSVTVGTPPAATSLVIAGPPVIAAGVATTFTVSARDTRGNIAVGYTGTVRVITDDSQATVPAEYTFTSGDGRDNGVHTFTVTLRGVGNHTVRVSDVGRSLTVTPTQVAVIPPPSFAANLALTVSAAPGPVATGDFNGDGRIDVAWAGSSGGSVGVLLGGALGTFTPGGTTAAGLVARAVAIGDVNGDGRTDLIALGEAAEAGAALAYFPGGGDGTLAAPIVRTLGGTPGALTVGDFNADGRTDAAVTLVGSGSQGGVRVLLGAVAGFQNPTSLTAGSQPVGIAVGDFNADGRTDLVVSSAPDRGPTGASLFYLPGNGTGGFGTAITSNAGAVSGALAAGDFNADGKLDIALANRPDGTVAIFTGSGTGSFQGGFRFTAGTDPVALAAEDVNGDGRLDLILPGGSANRLSVLLGSGNATFQNAIGIPVASGAAAVGAADFNADGRADLVATAGGTSEVVVLLNQAVGAPTAAASFRVAASSGSLVGGLSFPVTVTALNAAGNPATTYTGSVHLTSSDVHATLPAEVVFTAADAGVRTVWVTLRTAGGQSITATDPVHELTGTQNGITLTTFFGAPASLVPGPGPVAVAVGDVNGDGRPDVVSANAGVPTTGLGGGTFSVLPGGGDGSFAAAVNLQTVRAPGAVAVADLNGDGDGDVIVVGQRDTGAATGGVMVYLSNGDFTFQGVAGYATEASFAAVAVADLNGDSRPDLVAANPAGGAIAVLLGAGNGTFQTATSVTVGGNPVAVAVADVNGDARPDLVANLGNGVAVALGAGNGTFQNPTVTDTGTGGAGLVVTDLNADGKRDVAISFTGGVAVLLNSGQGAFPSSATFGAGSQPGALVVLDVNADGRPDLAVGNRDTNTASLLLGRGNGTFSSPISYIVGQGPAGLAAADVNADGAADLIAAAVGADAVPVLLNAGASQFQFSPAAFLATEGTGSATVTVTRTGNLFQQATVRYETLDGTAAAGDDYTPTSGTLTFGSGETSKSITITLSADSEIEGTETIRLRLSNPTAGATLAGGPAAAVLTIQDDDGVKNERLVMQLYQDLLGRPVDAAGLAFWSGQLNRGFSRLALAVALTSTAEYRALQVSAAYERILGREADAGGLTFFVNHLGRGGSMEQVEAVLYGSQEYFTRAGGSNAAFLQALYRDAFGRAADYDGLTTWSGLLDRNVSRTTVAVIVLGVREAREGRVRASYQSLLRRQADGEGLGFFVDFLGRNGRLEQIVAVLAGTDEYLGRL